MKCGNYQPPTTQDRTPDEAVAAPPNEENETVAARADEDDKKAVAEQPYKKQCKFRHGCNRIVAPSVSSPFCPYHYGNEEVICAYDGCNAVVNRGRGPRHRTLCYKHDEAYREKQRKKAAEWAARDRELVTRIRREHALRDKWMETVVARQGGRCANRALVAGKDGEPVFACPWNRLDEAVPPACQQLDHKTALFLGGGDERANLQMLCACCHAVKSAAERRAAADAV